MAIKVGGTTVINDSRAVSNVTTVSATAVSATTFTGNVSGDNVTATGTITAASFSGSGAGLTGISTVGKSIAMALVFGG